MVPKPSSNQVIKCTLSTCVYLYCSVHCTCSLVLLALARAQVEPVQVLKLTEVPFLKEGFQVYWHLLNFSFNNESDIIKINIFISDIFVLLSGNIKNPWLRSNSKVRRL